MTIFFALVVIALVVVIGGVLWVGSAQARAYVEANFLFINAWDPVAERERFGAAAAVYGTLMSSLIALALAAPIGVLVGIFLSELCPPKLRTPLSFLVELLAAIPSVIYGLWGALVVGPFLLNTLERPLAQRFGSSLAFLQNPSPKNLLVAGIILGIMILPTIAAITRDVLVVVPNTQREAMLALGATRWEAIWQAVLPYSRAGIVGGVMLGLGRALGETLAATLVIGNRMTIKSPLKPATDGGVADRQPAAQRQQRPPHQRADPDRPGALCNHAAAQRRGAAAGLGRKPRPSRGGPLMRTSLQLKNYGRRKALDRVMRGLTLGATILALVPLFLILGYVVVEGGSALSATFLTTDYKVPELSLDGSASDVGGIRHALVGTLLIAGTATLLALPIGLLAGVYLSEYGRGRLATAVRFSTDVLSGSPSIIAGVVVYILLVQTTHEKFAFFGSVALALLMIPIIVRTTEEILRLVPQTVREAGIALGEPRWKITLTVVIPTALSGILTGVMLAFARAAGETAPLIVTVFVSNSVTYNVFGDMGSLPMYIYRTLDELNDPGQYKVLWGAAFVLTALVLIINVLLRLVTRRRRS